MEARGERRRLIIVVLSIASRFLLKSPYYKAFIYTHTPIYISIVNNHTLLSEEQSLNVGRCEEAVRRKGSARWRAARGGGAKGRRSFYLLGRLFTEVERAKARSKSPAAGASAWRLGGREREARPKCQGWPSDVFIIFTSNSTSY